MSGKHPCIICGHKTLDNRGDWDICPVCFWEDDVILGNDDVRSPANSGVYVSEAQANFVKFGACRPEHVEEVRSPTDEEERDNSFELLPAALKLLEKHAND